MYSNVPGFITKCLAPVLRIIVFFHNLPSIYHFKCMHTKAARKKRKKDSTERWDPRCLENFLLPSRIPYKPIVMMAPALTNQGDIHHTTCVLSAWHSQHLQLLTELRRLIYKSLQLTHTLHGFWAWLLHCVWNGRIILKMHLLV